MPCVRCAKPLDGMTAGVGFRIRTIPKGLGIKTRCSCFSFGRWRPDLARTCWRNCPDQGPVTDPIAPPCWPVLAVREWRIGSNAPGPASLSRGHAHTRATDWPLSRTGTRSGRTRRAEKVRNHLVTGAFPTRNMPRTSAPPCGRRENPSPASGRKAFHPNGPGRVAPAPGPKTALARPVAIHQALPGIRLALLPFP